MCITVDATIHDCVSHQDKIECVNRLGHLDSPAPEVLGRTGTATEQRKGVGMERHVLYGGEGRVCADTLHTPLLLDY